ncbi:hypothetical protein ACSSS7_006548 [Eimeria intestinalis]
MASLLAAALASRMVAGQKAAGVSGPGKSAEQKQEQTKSPQEKPVQSLDQPKRKKEKQQLQERDRQPHQTGPHQPHRKPKQQQEQSHQRIQQQQQRQQQQREAHSGTLNSIAVSLQALSGAVASLQSGGSSKKRKRKEALAPAPPNSLEQICRRTQEEEAVVVEQRGLQQAAQRLQLNPQQLQQLQQQQLETQQAPIHQKPLHVRQQVERPLWSASSQHHKQQEPLQQEPQPSQQPHKQLQQPVRRQQQQQHQKQQQATPPKQQEQQPNKQGQEKSRKQNHLQQGASEHHQASQLWQRERAPSGLEGAASPRVGCAGIQVHQQAQPPPASHSLFTAHQVKSLQDGLRAFQQEAAAAPTSAAAAAAIGKAAALLLGAAARRLAAVAPRLSACFSRRMTELTQHHGIEVDPKVLQGLCEGCGVPLVPFLTSRLRTRPLASRCVRRSVVWRTNQQLLQRKAESAKDCLVFGVAEAPQDYTVPSFLGTVCKLCGHRVEMAAGQLRVVGGKPEHQKQQEQVAVRGMAFNKRKRQHSQQRRGRCSALQQQQRVPTEYQNEKPSSAIPTVFHLKETDASTAATGNCKKNSQSGFAIVQKNTCHSSSIGGTSSTAGSASVLSVTDSAVFSEIEKQAGITQVARAAQICGHCGVHSVEESGRDTVTAAQGSDKLNDKKVNSVCAILAELDC